jgi:LysR family transcriptional regulator, nitrogen assimilation regulatory protein
MEPRQAGRLNLAILFGERQYARLALTPLVEEALVFVAPGTWEGAAPGSAVSLTQVFSPRLILPDRLRGVRSIIEQAAHRAALDLANVVEVNSITILRSVLLAERGATIAPESIFRNELADGTLRSARIESCSLTRKLMLCASKTIPLSTAAQAIGDLLGTVVVDPREQGVWTGGVNGMLTGKLSSRFFLFK